MTYQLIGFCLLSLGICHRLKVVRNWDHQIAIGIQRAFKHQAVLLFSREIWFFGRTAFTLIFLALMTGYNWKLGGISLIVFGVMAGLEKLIKSTFLRPRPFAALEKVQMLQPAQPTDPSFPSGDALRVWFLVLILGIALGNYLSFGLLSILLAVLVSLGRMFMGVHYLTDVLAGAGLGFLGAGTTIWLWQLFHLL